MPPIPSRLLALPDCLAADWPVERWGDLTVVVAVSGGADSVALLRALAALRGDRSGQLVAAYFHHGWNPPQAAGEAAFVGALAKRLQLPCHVGQADPEADPEAGAAKRAGRPPDEQSARKARYRFLRAVAQQLGARHIVTAHTADDQAETILHRMLRGTGLRGLAGIPRLRRLSDDLSLVRPLLGVRRVQVLDYLAAVGQSYCQDASNRQARYTRNRLRHQLIPLLQHEYNAEVIAALTRLGRLAGENQRMMEQLVEPLRDSAVRRWSGSELHVDCRALADQPALVVSELARAIWRQARWPLQAMDYAAWTTVAAMLRQGHPQSATLPGGVQAVREDQLVRLTRPSGSAAQPAGG